jgi:hypothetical protein
MVGFELVTHERRELAMTLVGVFGSVLLMWINTTGIVIATDSLVNRSDGGTPSMGCKLVQVRQKVIFGATGIGFPQESEKFITPGCISFVDRYL